MNKYLILILLFGYTQLNAAASPHTLSQSNDKQIKTFNLLSKKIGILDLETFEMLFSDELLDMKDSNGNTLLNLAKKASNVDIVNFLSDKQKDIPAKKDDIAITADNNIQELVTKLHKLTIDDINEKIWDNPLSINNKMEIFYALIKLLDDGDYYNFIKLFPPISHPAVIELLNIKNSNSQNLQEIAIEKRGSPLSRFVYFLESRSKINNIFENYKNSTEEQINLLWQNNLPLITKEKIFNILVNIIKENDINNFKKWYPYKNSYTHIMINMQNSEEQNLWKIVISLKRFDFINFLLSRVKLNIESILEALDLAISEKNLDTFELIINNYDAKNFIDIIKNLIEHHDIDIINSFIARIQNKDAYNIFELIFRKLVSENNINAIDFILNKYAIELKKYKLSDLYLTALTQNNFDIAKRLIKVLEIDYTICKASIESDLPKFAELLLTIKYFEKLYLTKFLTVARKEGDLKVVEYLLKNNTQIVISKGNEKDLINDIEKACICGNLELFQKLISKTNVYDLNLNNLLAIAILRSNLNIIEFILSNYQDDIFLDHIYTNYSILHRAFMQKNPAIVKLLIETFPNQISLCHTYSYITKTYTIADNKPVNITTTKKVNLLKLAIVNDWQEIVHLLFDEITLPEDAASRKYLLESIFSEPFGPSINSKQYAEYEYAIKLFIERIGNININEINIISYKIDCKPWNLLFFAIDNKLSIDFLTFLVERGINVNFIDARYNSAIDMMKKSSYHKNEIEQFIKLLISKGAKK